jgi:hypothetical protein
MHREGIFTGRGSGARRPLGTRGIVDVSREAIVTGEDAKYGPGFETMCIDGTSDKAGIAAGIKPLIGELLRAIAAGLGLLNLGLLVGRQIVINLEGCLPHRL